MKKIILLATAVVFLFATTVMADSIDGKVGITARGGASYISNSAWKNPVDREINPDIGWTAGGGIMYGLTDNLAVNFDVIYFQAGLKASSPYDPSVGYNITTGKTYDFAVGVQWRFMPKSRFVPYVEAGFDAMYNEILLTDEWQASLDARGGCASVERTYGGHLSVGADYFITPNIALNAEIRRLWSTTGTFTTQYPNPSPPPGGNLVETQGDYNPSNISGFLGIRFFFGGGQEASTPIAKEIAPEPLPPPVAMKVAPEPLPPPPPVEEVKAAPEAAATVEQKIIEPVRTTLNVQFDTMKAVVKPAYYKNIEAVADVMKKTPALKIVVEGHTDSSSKHGDKYNLNLSQKRAEAIKTVMVNKFKIESDRITAKGFGSSKPIADNSTEEGRQINRRVEVEYVIEK